MDSDDKMFSLVFGLPIVGMLVVALAGIRQQDSIANCSNSCKTMASFTYTISDKPLSFGARIPLCVC